MASGAGHALRIERSCAVVASAFSERRRESVRLMSGRASKLRDERGANRRERSVPRPGPGLDAEDVDMRYRAAVLAIEGPHRAISAARAVGSGTQGTRDRRRTGRARMGWLALAGSSGRAAASPAGPRDGRRRSRRSRHARARGDAGSIRPGAALSSAARAIAAGCPCEARVRGHAEKGASPDALVAGQAPRSRRTSTRSLSAAKGTSRTRSCRRRAGPRTTTSRFAPINVWASRIRSGTSGRKAFSGSRGRSRAQARVARPPSAADLSRPASLVRGAHPSRDEESVWRTAPISTSTSTSTTTSTCARARRPTRECSEICCPPSAT